MIKDVDLIIHLAGINRASEHEVEFGNQKLATILTDALRKSRNAPFLIYSNSVHAGTGTPYGRGKAGADKIFSQWASESSSRYLNLLLPHVFGEGGRAFYNSVTSTFCQQLVDGNEPTISGKGEVELLHAGAVADIVVSAIDSNISGAVRPEGKPISVQSLYEKLKDFKTNYNKNELPDLTDSTDLALFNTYRSFEFPRYYPQPLQLNKDSRGVLFEAVKGGGGGQTFLSWTEPGIERGNHFHRNKVERFLVVSGKAEIRIRALWDDVVHAFSVSGDSPESIDIPTLHTHSIKNIGSEPLLTLFWAHEIFNPDHPDTYAHKVEINKNTIISYA